jgi:hypothetical protein
LEQPNFIKIASYDNYMLANMTLGLLEDNNINCHLRDENTVTIDPLLSNAIGGIKLMVHAAQADRANELIQQAEAAWLNELTCTRCKKPGIVKLEKINNPQSLCGKLKNQLAYGQTVLLTISYQCKNCSAIFEAPPV